MNSVTKIFVITVKGLGSATSCVRDQDSLQDLAKDNSMRCQVKFSIQKRLF